MFFEYIKSESNARCHALLLSQNLLHLLMQSSWICEEFIDIEYRVRRALFGLLSSWKYFVVQRTVLRRNKLRFMRQMNRCSAYVCLWRCCANTDERVLIHVTWGLLTG